MHVGKIRHYFANKKLAAHISKPNSGPMTKGPRITFAIDGRVEGRGEGWRDRRSDGWMD